MMSYTMACTSLCSIGGRLILRTSPCTRIIGGKPAERCKSEALFLTPKASSSVISIYNSPCVATRRRSCRPFPVTNAPIMTAIASNLQAVRTAIAQAARAAHRQPGEITLLAVSKTFPAPALRVAYEAGQRAFGENYLQEALDKIAVLRDLPLEWHFIGPIQSNKTRAIAENFSWVHGVDRLKIAERLSAQRPANLPPLQVCIQVNVSGEDSKSGIALHEAAHLARQVAALPRLALRGLMAIPAPAQKLDDQRR